MQNLLLYLRDISKLLCRLLEQIIARLILVERAPKTAIAVDARLDIGKKISFNPQPSVYKLCLKQGAKIESCCTINSWLGAVTIGKNSGLGIGSVVIGPVSIGDNCSIAQHVFISGENRLHSYTKNGLLPPEEGVDLKPVEIGHGVWIGSGVKIMPGVKIGDAVIIASGAVVTKDIPSHCLAGGVPAKVIREHGPKQGNDNLQQSDFV